MRMIFRMVAALLCVVASASFAQERLSDPFSAQGLTRAEKRILQAGLAYEGHYNALLDGAWGGGSQRSLVAMVQERHEVDTPNWNHVARLLRRTQRELTRGGWHVVAPQGLGASTMLPLARLEPTPTRNGLQYANDKKTLRVQFIRQSLPQALTLANAVANRHAGNGRPYQSFSNKRLILAVTLDGGGAYLRAAEAQSGVGSILVEWKDVDAESARLIVAALASGTQEGLSVPKRGTLDRVLKLAAKRSGDAPKAPDPKPSAAAPGPIAGTGFYVNNTDIVTAAAVVQGCGGRLQLADGARLRSVATDVERGVAILTTGRRSNTWMPVGRAQINDGQPARVATFDPAATGTGAAARIDPTIFVVLQGINIVRGTAAPTQIGSAVLNDRFELAGLLGPVTAGVRGATPVVPSQDIAAALRDARVTFVRRAQDGDAETGALRAQRVMRHLFCSAS
ncbi:MAG: hypothetical protein AAFP16_10930 [Pseudomonadota bacterium]